MSLTHHTHKTILLEDFMKTISFHLVSSGIPTTDNKIISQAILHCFSQIQMCYNRKHGKFHHTAYI